jgi:hypothetical protein
VHQLVQAAHGLGAVHVLAAVLLRFDHQHALCGDAPVGQRQQAGLDVVMQGRRRDVKAQVDGAGHLVHVLPARTLGADGRDLVLVNRNGVHGHAL